MLAGVCGGLGEYLGVEPVVVRVIAILLAIFSSAPVLVAYLIAAALLPVGDAPLRVDVDWRADGLRVVYRAPIAPHAIAWHLWIGLMMAGVTGLTALMALVAVLFALALHLTEADPVGAVAVVTSTCGILWPAAALFALGGLLHRPYALTVTHDALWVERPFRAAVRVDLAQVEAIHHDSDGVTIHLRNAALLQLPTPPPAAEVATVWEQIEAGRRRALEHRVDLEEARPRLRELERVLDARRTE